MADQIYPCFWFDGQAKAAADLYCSVFGNSRITSDSPLVVTFELNGKKIMGLNGGPMYKINPSISLFVYCGSIAETERIYNRLIVDGDALMPLDSYPWSKKYGWLRDRFGVTWQISVSDTEGSNLKITPSMLFTSGQFGRAEEAIQFYGSVFDNSSTGMLLHYLAEDPNHGKVLYSEFKLNDYGLIAMDGPGVHEYSFDEGVSFVVGCQTQQEIDYYWSKLTEGGHESMCGWLIDKFGVSWQIVPSTISEMMADPEKAARVVKACMNMKKLDMETLLNA
jgi:predicted 3-demethylubiquinone-9 3-methyltransferase (glyoxalase superfamily)